MSENIKNLVKGENFLIESLSDPIQAKIEWSSLDNKSIDISAFILTNEKFKLKAISYILIIFNQTGYI